MTPKGFWNKMAHFPRFKLKKILILWSHCFLLEWWSLQTVLFESSQWVSVVGAGIRIGAMDKIPHHQRPPAGTHRNSGGTVSDFFDYSQFVRRQHVVCCFGVELGCLPSHSSPMILVLTSEWICLLWPQSACSL